MGFHVFSEAPIAGLIDDCANAQGLTVMLGAGASIEAGLPSWPTLIERLLVRSAREHDLLDAEDGESRERWVAEAIRNDGYLGAAAIVGALTGETTLETWIPLELYGEGRTSADYLPGPICRRLPALAKAYGSSFRLMTTNYDDLAEEALRNDPTHPIGAVPYVGAHVDVAPGEVKVEHLHGYAGRDGLGGPLVLSEADYQRMQQESSWQESHVRSALDEGMFVFVGASLADPNLIRYLHGRVGGGEIPPRYAIFVRQDAYEEGVPLGVREAREDAIRARWEKVGVKAVFVDHYVDVAQLLHEMAAAKTTGGDCTALPERARAWVDGVADRLLGLGEDRAFFRGQEVCNEQLRAALAAAVRAAEELESRSWDETLALTLWLIDEDGSHLVNRATTDRLHVDRSTIEPVEIDEYARWVAVRSYCRGQSLAERREIYASRWRFIRGTPLVVENERFGRIPVGCLTTSSMSEPQKTMLNEMEDVVEARFNHALTSSVLALLDQPFR